MKRIIACLMAVLMVAAFGACNMSGAIVYDLGNVDRASYFKSIYDKYVEDFGKAAVETDSTYGEVLKGVAVARLLDFTGEGDYELYLAYADGTKPYVNKQLVVGFDNGPGTLIDEEITSMAAADAKAPSIWLYTDDNDRAYIVKGEDMSASADYCTYFQTKDGEELYQFDVDFTETNGTTPAGKIEKINVTGVTKEDKKAILEENEKVVDSINGQAKKK